MFTGCVEVRRNKISVALENHRQLFNPLNQRYNRLMKEAEEKYETLTWWQRFHYDGDFFFQSKARAYLNSLGAGYSVWRSCLVRVFVYTKDFTEEEANDYERGCDEGSTYQEINAFFKAGNPVYLNPTQAKFINKYYIEGK